MSALGTSLTNLNRLREISAVVARHGFGELFERSRLFEQVRPVRTEEAADRATARRLRQLLTELGPTFVKLGQVLSTRADVFPTDIIRELSELQDQVPPFDFAAVRAQVEAGLRRTLEDAYSEFDPQPLASASISQVHKARTRAGVEVIVKVQRPGIRQQITADLDLLFVIARFLESFVADTELTSPKAIVEEFEAAILGELQFTREAANIHAFQRANEGRPYVVVPHVLESLSCETVLTLERLDGVKITDWDPERHDRAEIAKNLIETAFVGLFKDGLFHGDPHPGNLFVLEGNRIGLIDFGLVGRLTRPMQETLIVMCLAISLKDAGTLARLLYKVGIPHERVSLQALAADIQAVLDRYLRAGLATIDSRSLLGDLVDLAQRYKIRIPREYAVLAKAAVTIEGVVRRLCPDLDVLAVALPYARRLLYDRLNPTTKDGSARRLLLQMQGLATDVPSQLAQVLMDLEAGKLNVTNRAVEAQLAQLVAGVRLLAVTVLCASVGLGALWWLAQPGVPLSPARWALGGAAALFLVSFGWLVLGIRPRKLRLRK
jgi:ubiquinone biosynthesis protein